MTCCWEAGYVCGLKVSPADYFLITHGKGTFQLRDLANATWVKKCGNYYFNTLTSSIMKQWHLVLPDVIYWEIHNLIYVVSSQKFIKFNKETKKSRTWDILQSIVLGSSNMPIPWTWGNYSELKEAKDEGQPMCHPCLCSWSKFFSKSTKDIWGTFRIIWIWNVC